MYKSPIELIYKEVQYQVEDGIYKAIQQVDIKVDREELIKALKYDRDQYNKGYEDAKAERKKGEWIKRTSLFQCSACERFFTLKYNYCPNCGCEMTKGADNDPN